MTVTIEPNALIDGNPELTASEAVKQLIEEGIYIHTAAEVRPISRKWLLKDMVPENEPTILAGEGGVGKSTWATWLSAHLTRGTAVGDFVNEPIRILYITAEDSWTTTQAARLSLAGADMDRVFIPTFGEREFDNPFLPRMGSEGVGHYDKLLTAVQPRLIVLDNVGAVSNGDMNDMGNVRQLMSPFINLARKHHCASLLLHHLRKGQGSLKDRVSGSHAFPDSVRSVLGMALDAQMNPVLGVVKSNYAPANLECYRITRDIEAYYGEDGSYMGDHPVMGEWSQVPMGVDALLSQQAEEASSEAPIEPAPLNLESKIIEKLEELGEARRSRFRTMFGSPGTRPRVDAILDELISSGIVAESSSARGAVTIKLRGH